MWTAIVLLLLNDSFHIFCSLKRDKLFNVDLFQFFLLIFLHSGDFVTPTYVQMSFNYKRKHSIQNQMKLTQIHKRRG